MADQNVNIQFFDRGGGTEQGRLPPEAAPRPEGNTHTPPPGYNPNEERRAPNEQGNQPEPPPQFPTGQILDILGSAINPVIASTLGQPVASAISSVVNVGRSVSNLHSVLTQGGNAPPGGGTPPGLPPGTPPGPGSGTAPTPGSPPGPPGPGPGPAPSPTPGGPPGLPPGPTPPGPPGGGGGGLPGPGSAVGGLLAMGPEAVAAAAVVAAVVAAAAALTAAFLYAKDKLLEAADEVAMFAPGTAQAKAESRVQDVMNRINRAQELEPQFEKLIRAQTEFNRSWNEYTTEIMRLITPAITTILKLVTELVMWQTKAYEGLQIIINNIYAVLQFLEKWNPIYKAIMSWLRRKSDDDNKDQTKQIELMRQADAILNPLLRDVQVGKVPRNKGLGG